MSTNGRSQTYVARLHPWAAGFNLKPHLSSVTLANVLSGDTCPPISLADFEAYLAFREHSVENLQFVVWFQDYRKRFFELPQSAQMHNPGPREFSFAAPSHAEIERRAAASLPCPALANRRTDSPSLEDHRDSIITIPNLPTFPEPALPSPTSPTPLLVPPEYTELSSPLNSACFPDLPKPDSDEKQPLRTECMRIVATFLRPGAPKELTLDAIVRDTVVRNLAYNTHPDVFLPAYEEMYDMVERTSLPRFLSFATANINLPKQLFWYFVGLADMSIGIALAISLITMIHTPPESNRAWRLFAIPFAWFGSMQFYSAWRGFCNQVWLRGNVQLRVWEMNEVDEESKIFVDRILEPPDQPQQNHERQLNAGHVVPVPIHIPSTTDDKSTPVIAPFAYLDNVPGSRSRPSHPGAVLHPSKIPDPPPKRVYPLPPIFGPERIVQDPRIKAVHQKVMNDILHVGFWFTLVFSAIILSVPSRIRL